VLEVPEELRDEFEQREGVIVGGRGGRMPFQEEASNGATSASDTTPTADAGTDASPAQADVAQADVAPADAPAATEEAPVASDEAPAPTETGSEDAPATMGEDADTRVSAGDALDTE
jgi:cell division protein FtsN